MFHQALLLAAAQPSSHYLGEMATRIDYNPAGDLFLTQTHTSPVRVAFGHLWYNLGIVAGPINATPLGILPVCQEVYARPTLGLMPLAPHTSLLPPMCALSLNGSRPELSYLASRSE
jgi:hypothetical protein